MENIKFNALFFVAWVLFFIMDASHDDFPYMLLSSGLSVYYGDRVYLSVVEYRARRQNGKSAEKNEDEFEP